MGIYGYPPQEGARVAVRTVATHLGDETHLELVRFVLFSDDTHELFEEALAELP
jgi:O-acetyl-ADP-ribose deacetylase (regulator of RNase III)